MKDYLEFGLQWKSRIKEEEEEEEEPLWIWNQGYDKTKESEQHQRDIGECIRGRRQTSQT